MQTITLTRKQLDEYRTGMQRNAAAFVDLHQQEHLDDDGLFDRTVNHLVNVWGVPVFMAGRLVHLAMTDRLPRGKSWIGVDVSSGSDLCLIRDYRIGKTYPVSARLLPHRFLHSPADTAPL